MELQAIRVNDMCRKLNKNFFSTSKKKKTRKKDCKIVTQTFEFPSAVHIVHNNHLLFQFYFSCRVNIIDVINEFII